MSNLKTFQTYSSYKLVRWSALRRGLTFYFHKNFGSWRRQDPRLFWVLHIAGPKAIWVLHRAWPRSGPPMTQVYFGSCTAHDPRLSWILHKVGPKEIWVLHWAFVHWRTEGYFGFSVLGPAPGRTWVLHRPDPRLFGSCTAQVCWPGAQDCRPCLADLQTLGSRAADSFALGLQPGARVCPQCPRLGKPRAKCLYDRTSANLSAR